MAEAPVPAPPAIETVDVTRVRDAIDFGDGNEWTPDAPVHFQGFEGSGMALGERTTKMLHCKNENKAGRGKSSDEKKRVRTATDNCLALMDSNEKKISWFPDNNNKQRGVLMITGRHHREKGTNKSFAVDDDGTVWSQVVTCSTHQSPGSSTH